jgi:hypothetical protein
VLPPPRGRTWQCNGRTQAIGGSLACSGPLAQMRAAVSYTKREAVQNYMAFGMLSRQNNGLHDGWDVDVKPVATRHARKAVATTARE